MAAPRHPGHLVALALLALCGPGTPYHSTYNLDLQHILEQPQLVESGFSLNRSTVAEVKQAGRGTGGPGVRCIISIANWSMYTLLDVERNTECGVASSRLPPRNVFPGYREVMVMQNTNPMMGTCGTLSWQLVEINMRLIIMWSVPFNFNLRDSYYAIGLTHNKGKFMNSAYWFNQMYYGNNSAFRRSRTGRPLTFSSSLISVRGFMEANTYHAVLNISIMPRRTYHLAESIQRRIIFSSLPPEMTRSSDSSLPLLSLPLLSLPLLTHPFLSLLLLSPLLLSLPLLSSHLLSLSPLSLPPLSLLIHLLIPALSFLACLLPQASLPLPNTARDNQVL